MSNDADVSIIGGGVIGSAIAYFLCFSSDFDGTVVVLEQAGVMEGGAEGQVGADLPRRPATVPLWGVMPKVEQAARWERGIMAVVPSGLSLVCFCTRVDVW